MTLISFFKERRKWMKHKKFVVFLDVDGVLNTSTTVKRTPNDYTGIDNARVAILANAIEQYGEGDIILSSDWKKLKETHEDYLYLVEKLAKHNLLIAGKTEGSNRARGAGILAYLAEHPEIEEYIILDDNKFDFQDHKKLWERLLITNGIERARFASNTPAVEAILFMEYIKAVN